MKMIIGILLIAAGILAFFGISIGGIIYSILLIANNWSHLTAGVVASAVIVFLIRDIVAIVVGFILVGLGAIFVGYHQ